MVRAWYYQGTQEKHLPNLPDPAKFLEPQDLQDRLRILCHQLDADNWEKDGRLKSMLKERNYTSQDCVMLDKNMKDFDATMEKFFTEHLHCDEEIRFIIDGSGYFDVRDENDQWIRIEITKGDLIILPGGIYHRFSFDTNNYIKVVRCFSEVPVWTAFNRCDPKTEQMEIRQKYKTSLKNG